MPEQPPRPQDGETLACPRGADATLRVGGTKEAGETGGSAGETGGSAGETGGSAGETGAKRSWWDTLMGR